MAPVALSCLLGVWDLILHFVASGVATWWCVSVSKLEFGWLAGWVVVVLILCQMDLVLQVYVATRGALSGPSLCVLRC